MNTVKRILLTTLLVGVVGCSEMDLTKVVEQTPATSAAIEVIEVPILREHVPDPVVAEIVQVEEQVVTEELPETVVEELVPVLVVPEVEQQLI